ncbi:MULTISPECIES: MarR family transcriptional regulator [unclassified Burkholderia]|uniref:MarR family transcriptional regulator n=1 Tax=unclassified Burkholderia TaxID=2613784 RepID=UPI001420B312|nr:MULTISPECIES: MarR family transcriptional regulator [unclassified Burkholderia]NIE56031.1 MarR family transcriptional regulator [Burkholderia sp. Ap-955]NIF09815.1 MarR family transcriptional regulator [Burkholderia sp. Ax-1735]NIG03527.1 MarR family transcriptional regulator [Burkholderia sp. Tr-849]
MPTQQQISDHLDLDQSAVSRFVDKVQLDYRVASIDEIRIAYIRHLREVAAGRSSGTGIDLVAERAKTEIVDREIKLLSLSDKLVQELHTLYGVGVDVEWLNERIYGCLEQLSEYDPDSPRSDSPDREDAASAGADWDDGLGAQTSKVERKGIGQPRPV